MSIAEAGFRSRPGVRLALDLRHRLPDYTVLSNHIFGP